MDMTTFERTLHTAILAESLCISYMSELLFQEQPTKENIQRGYVLANELWQALADALNNCDPSASHEVTHKRLQVLKHCNITHSESLLLLDQVTMKYLRS
jgi:hypothetical protein